MSDPLTREDCENVLRVYLRGKDWKLISYEINSLSDTVEGFIGEHYIAKMTYEEDTQVATQRFFVKVLNGKSEVVFKMSESLNAFGKEEFFYNYFIKELDKENIDVSYAPVSYLCENHKFVLEDLGVRQYKMTPTLEPFDLVHCKVALDALSKMHTSALIYEDVKGIKFGTQFPQVLVDKFFSKEDNWATKWFKCSRDGVVTLIDCLNITDAEKLEFKNNVKVLTENLLDIIKPRENETATVLHGDVWSNNFLFRYENDKPVDCVLVDYQILKYGSPALDVLHMIMSNTRKSFRDDNYTELLKYYKRACLGRLRSSGVSEEEVTKLDSFQDVCERVKVVVKLAVIVDRSVTLLSGECMEEVQSDDALHRFLFEDRAKSMADSFAHNELYREIIEEDMMEFMELLTQVYNQ